MLNREKTEKLRIAIIGCGWIAGSHMSEGFKRLPDLFDVVTACDADPGKAERFARQYGIPAVCGRYEAVLCDPLVDAVSLCTPPLLHYPMVMAALRAGKHVICEKPLTSSLRLTDEIIAGERSSRARVMPVFQYRFGPGVERVKRLLESGIAGRAFTASIETAWKRDAGYYSVPWRGKFATELGGVLVTQSIHNHDMLMYLTGDVAQVSAFKTTRVNDIEVEDCAVAALRMQDGSLASLTATLGSQRQVTRIRLCFENLTIERQCFDEEAYRPGDEPWIVIPRDAEIAARIDALPAEQAGRLTSFSYQFAAFHDALRTGQPFPVSLADARRSLELISALYHAAETGEMVPLPITNAHPRYNGWAGGNTVS